MSEKKVSSAPDPAFNSDKKAKGYGAPLASKTAGQPENKGAKGYPKVSKG